jgi:short-subunit dehydrogenase
LQAAEGASTSLEETSRAARAYAAEAQTQAAGPTSMKIAGTRALVTGASSGIGAATARALAVRGASVILVARNTERLTTVTTGIQVSGGRAAAYVADLAQPQEVSRVARLVHEQHGIPNIVVNNAGAGRWLPIVDTSADELAAMVAVPFLAAFNLTREFLPGMRQRGTGHIVNVTSVGSFLVWPNAAAYISARWAMRGFNEALRAEVHGSRIGVSLVGFAQVSSSFWEHNPGSWERLPAPAHRMRTLTPDEAAAAVVEAIEREKRLLLRPRMIYLLRVLNTVLPRGTERQMWR